MPISTKHAPDTSTLFVTADAIITMADRKKLLAFLDQELGAKTADYILFDLRTLAGENDPKEELAFGDMLAKCMAPFKSVRAAVVLSEAFLISSTVVLRVQQQGVNMMDFRSLDEARAWLYSDAR